MTNYTSDHTDQVDQDDEYIQFVVEDKSSKFNHVTTNSSILSSDNDTPLTNHNMNIVRTTSQLSKSLQAIRLSNTAIASNTVNNNGSVPPSAPKTRMSTSSFSVSSSSTTVTMSTARLQQTPLFRSKLSNSNHGSQHQNNDHSPSPSQHSDKIGSSDSMPKKATTALPSSAKPISNSSVNKSSASSIASSFGFMLKHPSSLPMKKSESALGRLFKAMSQPRDYTKQSHEARTITKHSNEVHRNNTSNNDTDGAGSEADSDSSYSSDDMDEEHAYARGVPQQEQFVRFWVRQAYESINDPIMVIDSKAEWVLFMNSACRSLLQFKQPSSRHGSMDKSAQDGDIDQKSQSKRQSGRRLSQSVSRGIIPIEDCLSCASSLFSTLRASLNHQTSGSASSFPHRHSHYDVQLVVSDGSFISRRASLGVLKRGIKDRTSISSRQKRSFSSGSHHDEFGFVLTFISAESPQSSTMSPRPSRYETEFQELERLGKGGFGDVYKARNLLDGQDYAIKKVKLSCHPDELQSFGDGSSPSTNVDGDWGKGHQRKLSAIDNRLVQEAKTFALLSNHPNVVRYYNAWIEPISSNDNGISMSRTGSNRRSQRKSAGPGVHRNPSSASASDDHDYTESTGDDEEDDEYSHRVHNATLYIQMQLYPYHDLRHWIKSRTSIDRQANLSVFHQLLSGLSHIHRQNVIHRDIKPENVFMHGLHVYLGDFGLAKSIAEHLFLVDEEMQDCDADQQFDEQVKASGNHGTYFYMAPEILSSQVCTRKSDVYSCGIVLFELFSTFDTAMERAVTLTNLKKKQEIPESFSSAYPDIAHIVSLLIQDDPSSRPTAEDILSDLLYMQSVQHSIYGGSHGSTESEYSPPSTGTIHDATNLHGHLQSPTSEGVFFYEDGIANAHSPIALSGLSNSFSGLRQGPPFIPVVPNEGRRSSMESDRSITGRNRTASSRQRPHSINSQFIMSSPGHTTGNAFLPGNNGSLHRKTTSSVFWMMSNASLPRYPSPGFVRQGSSHHTNHSDWSSSHHASDDQASLSSVHSHPNQHTQPQLLPTQYSPAGQAFVHPPPLHSPLSQSEFHFETNSTPEPLFPPQHEIETSPTSSAQPIPILYGSSSNNEANGLRMRDGNGGIYFRQKRFSVPNTSNMTVGASPKSSSIGSQSLMDASRESPIWSSPTHSIGLHSYYHQSYPYFQYHHQGPTPVSGDMLLGGQELPAQVGLNVIREQMPYHPISASFHEPTSYGAGYFCQPGINNTPPSSSRIIMEPDLYGGTQGDMNPLHGNMVRDKERIKALEADVAALQAKVAALMAEKVVLLKNQPNDDKTSS